jgi:WhiB family transcriptional regulator, redox-sensing transcriptional regulator
MAATATPEPPTGVSLIELALGAGYAFADQRWRLHAACAGVDPETFLPTRGASFEEALSYCRRCPVRCACLQAAFDLGQKAVGVWGGTSARERRVAKRRGLSAPEVLAETRPRGRLRCKRRASRTAPRIVPVL